MNLAGLKGLKHHRLIAIIVVLNLVKIVESLSKRQVLAPIVGVALIDNEASRFHFFDSVRSGGQRRFQSRRGNIAILPEAHRQRRQARDCGQRLHAVLCVEVELHPLIIQRFGALDRLIHGLDHGAGELFFGLQRVHEIFGNHRGAIVIAGFFAYGENRPALIGWKFDTLGQLAVVGVYLVVGTDHQTVIQQAYARRPIAFSHMKVQRVITAELTDHDAPTFGCIRVSVRK